MKVGQHVLILDHPKAKPWHKAIVGQVSTIVGVSITIPQYGTYYNLEATKGHEGGIAGICLRPVDDPSEFQRFMGRVMKPVKLPKEIMA
jgi:hypothetical protein